MYVDEVSFKVNMTFPVDMPSPDWRTDQSIRKADLAGLRSFRRRPLAGLKASFASSGAERSKASEAIKETSKEREREREREQAQARPKGANVLERLFYEAKRERAEGRKESRERKNESTLAVRQSRRRKRPTSSTFNSLFIRRTRTNVKDNCAAQVSQSVGRLVNECWKRDKVFSSTCSGLLSRSFRALTKAKRKEPNGNKQQKNHLIMAILNVFAVVVLLAAFLSHNLNMGVVNAQSR